MDRLRSFGQMMALALASAALFWLVTEHWRHLGGVLAFAPYLLFLSCPLMHLLMHHGRSHGGHPTAPEDQPAPTRPAAS
jgi:hypothetical protein